MKKILVAIGGIKFSQKVLAEAKDIAEATGCKVTLLNVMDLAREEYFIYDKEFLDGIRAGALKHSEETLQNAKELFSGFKGELETVSKTGNPADEIIDFAENGGYDLIIMGSRGEGLFTRSQLGSVADKVVHHADVSVLIIK